jgi:hypothetical protein
MPDATRLCLEERKKFLQRRLKNKTKFSSNWRKLQTRIKKIDRRIANIRGNHRHQFTNTVTKNHGVVYGDDLSVKTMSKSAQGTIKAPGKNVKQKSRLNRLLLAQDKLCEAGTRRSDSSTVCLRAVGIFGLQAGEEVKGFEPFRATRTRKENPQRRSRRTVCRLSLDKSLDPRWRFCRA